MNDSTHSASHPAKLQYPHFELIFGDFAPALLEVSFAMIFRDSSGTNHRGKCSEKQFYADTLVNTNDNLSLLQLTELFCHFSFTFLLKIPSSLLHLTFKGHHISLSRRASSSPSNIQCNSM